MNSEKASPFKSTTSCDPSSSNINNLTGAIHGAPRSVQTAQETDFNEVQTKIDLHEFLDFLNVSCHVNELISNNNNHSNNTNENERPTTGNNAAAKKPKSNVNFQKLAENRLVNELYAHNKTTTRLDDSIASEQHHQQQQQQHNAFAMGVANIERASLQRRRSSGDHNTTVSAATGGSNSITWRKTESTSSAAAAPAARTTAGLHPKLTEKLEFVINEGVLDSVLPFICPVQALQTNAATAAASRAKAKPKDAQTRKDGNGGCSSMHETAESAHCGITECEKETTLAAGDTNNTVGMVKFKDQRSFNRSNRSHAQYLSNADDRREPEVIIHVCDEVKNTSRDFSCPQSLLVSKMGYFADVTAGQKLDDMDISVHCDIHIFDWLMRWVKHSANGMDMTQHGTNCASTAIGGVVSTIDAGPQLDASNVVPILVSASFLQMEPLFADCLSFCHARLSEVVRMSTNLSCLNDSIMTRLAAMFTNSELEMVRDKKERVTPRLWTKLIQSLCEPEPEALRGHFFSLAGLFRCARCEKCLTNTMKSYISCLPSNVRLNRWGQLVSHHVRDSAWDINTYITQLFKEQKSWRKVYWKLWGHCHFLYCCACETHFPVYQMAWCRYHPEGPNFLGPVSEGRIAGPTGRYPCCGQQAFRFETMPGPNGCQFREHSVLVETDRERAILGIVQLVFEGHALCEQPPLKLQEVVANSGDADPRWTGLSLMPQRCRQGLLPVLNPDESTARIARRARRGGNSNYFVESSSESDTSDTLDDVPTQQTSTRRRYLHNATCASFSTSSDGCESDFSDIKTVHSKKGARKRQTDTPGRHWSGELSARSNQDHQREFEEKVMKQVIAIVSKKIGSEHATTQNSLPLGGTYVRLEAEWKEQLKQRNNSNFNQTTNVVSGSNQLSSTSMTSSGAAASNSKQKK